MGPRQVEVRDEWLSAPNSDELLIRVELTGISAGTEMLVYRGELPDAMSPDVDAVTRGITFPTTFGYCAVGRVEQLGAGAKSDWQHRRVFSFQPHASAFLAAPENLVAVPEDIPAQDAIFLANMETAVNLIHDAAPLLGERILVLGQGTVGLLTASLLREFPLRSLVTADMHAIRRRASAQLGGIVVVDPADPDCIAQARSISEGLGFDAVVELTGNPKALDMAIELAAYSGRIIVGSWYGRRVASIDLGGRFHRSRIRLQSSQVSTIAPELSGRWSKARRFEVAWEAMRRIRPSCWITQRFPVDRAKDAFRLLDLEPQSAIQVVLEYPAAN